MAKDNIIFRIRELDPDMIAPSTKNMNKPDQGGSKIVVIGKPGTGKTTLITSLIQEKSHIFPVGVVMSGTEDSNGHYGKINDPLFQGIFKNGRHWKMWFILSLQYSLDIKPVIRTNVDGTFILRESNMKNRKSLWENYAGVFPDFNMFCEVLDQLTDDYTALYVHNQTTSNKIEDCVFWYKAKPLPPNFRVGCDDFWDFHEERFDKNQGGM